MEPQVALTVPISADSAKRNLPEKVGLIIPPSLFLEDELVFMSLGILKVAANLQKHGVIVKLLDLSGEKNYEQVAANYMRANADVKWFGITATTPHLPAAVKVANAMRTVRSDAKIVLGGPHVTLVNSAYKGELKRGRSGRAIQAMEQLRAKFDHLVAGDGEDAIFELFLDNPEKLVDADDPRSSLFLNNERLTELPWPARDLINVERYKFSIDGVPALSLIAQLGCPFRCGFCGGRKSPSLQRIRTRPSENIVAEMEEMYLKYGRRGFMLYDDELNVNPKMVELMDLIAKKQRDLGVEWRLRGFIKSQLFREDQAKAMYDAGFRWILVGFESGSEHILKAMNKAATRDQNTRCMEIAHKYGLKVKALMSVGHPGENPQSLADSEAWLRQVHPDELDVALITTYPGTPYYDEAEPNPDKPGEWIYSFKETGAKLYQLPVDYTVTADYYKGKRNGGYKSYVYTDELTPDQLVAGRNRIEDEIRKAFGIPYAKDAAARSYEHSMGQMGEFPASILGT